MATFAMMMPACNIVVMRAAFGHIEQLAVEVGIGQFFDGGSRGPGAHGNALLRKEGQRATANTPGDDHLRALLAQPAREQARRVRRGGHGVDAKNPALCGIGLHKGKVCAAAKMFVQAAFGRRYGNGHRQWS